MLDTTTNVISINDVVETLRRDPTEESLRFASDLTGLSIDALWQMMTESGANTALPI